MSASWSCLKVLGDVREERQRQLEKWGDQHHDDAWWCVIEMEELGEVARAIFEWAQDPEDLGWVDRLRAEWVQVAAVAVAAIEDIDSQYEPLS